MEESFFNNNNSPYSGLNLTNNYMDICEMNIDFNETNLAILSLNIHSLSAKINELRELVDILVQNKIAPDFITLQEIWKIDDPKFFDIKGYHPLVFNSRSNSRGGGVGIYIKNDYNFHIINELNICLEKIF
jgi:exonuclease III